MHQVLGGSLVSQAGLCCSDPLPVLETFKNNTFFNALASRRLSSSEAEKQTKSGPNLENIKNKRNPLPILPLMDTVSPLLGILPPSETPAGSS